MNFRTIWSFQKKVPTGNQMAARGYQTVDSFCRWVAIEQLEVRCHTPSCVLSISRVEFDGESMGKVEHLAHLGRRHFALEQRTCGLPVDIHLKDNSAIESVVERNSVETEVDVQEDGHSCWFGQLQWWLCAQMRSGWENPLTPRETGARQHPARARLGSTSLDLDQCTVRSSILLPLPHELHLHLHGKLGGPSPTACHQGQDTVDHAEAWPCLERNCVWWDCVDLTRRRSGCERSLQD